MFPVNPVRELVNVPMPELSEVFASEIVGFSVIPQQIPLAVIEAPLSSVIFPPEAAVVCVMEDISDVVKTGTSTCRVVNTTGFP